MKKKTKANRTVATLAANPRNPNKMADEDKARMAKSLAEFGDLSGIIFNRSTGLLVGGHQRSSVMQSGKIVITESLTKPDRDGTVARGYVEYLGVQYQYREVDWPESRANAAMLAANRFGRVGEDDPGTLKDILLECDTGAFDMALTGFDENAMEDLMTACPPESKLEKKTLQQLPHTAWCLIGIPLSRYDEIAEHIEAISLNDGIIIESTVTNEIKKNR